MKTSNNIPGSRISVARYALLHSVVAITLVALASVPALATTRRVTNLNDSGAGSLRDVIAQSINGDRVEFDVTGTISLISAELTIARSITIVGPGAANLTIKRLTGAQGFRILHVLPNGAAAPSVSISGLTISGGSDFGGGGLFNESSQVTVTDCVIGPDNLDRGGSGGGGILSSGTQLNPANLTLINCSVRNNVNERSAGGGIAAVGEAPLTIKNCTISANQSLAIDGSGGFGGGIYANSNGIVVTNSTIANNLADVAGGGFYTNGTSYTRTFTNCTFSKNTAAQGGGIYNGGFSIRNTIVAGNDASFGPDVATQAQGPQVNSQGHNLVGKTDDSSGWVASDLTGTSGAPLDPQLAQLADNGGPTQTMALSSTSAAIDAGDDAVLAAPLNLTTDQRGTGFPRKFGAHVDIGAYEFDAAQSGANFVVTTVADHDDGVCGVADCTLREAINAANAISGANTITFAPNLIGTIKLGSALPDVSTNVNVHGPGARILAVSGNGAARIFSFSAGTSTVSGLTIRDGMTVGDLGSALGGGIYNLATLTLNDCTLSANHVQGFNGVLGISAGEGDGGAIYNGGVLNLNRCTLNGNSAAGGRGANSSFRNGARSGASGNGGAVYNETGGALTLADCTIVSNSASGGGGGDGGSTAGGNGAPAHGGVFNRGSMTMTACTLSGNSGTGGVGGSGTPAGTNGTASGSLANLGTATVRNTLSAGNSGSGAGPDADGAFSSGGYNLIGIGDFSSGFTNTGDQVGTTAAPIIAKLGALQNNGGGTDTMSLLTGSPALDKGKSFGLTTDQRGVGYKRTVDKAIANATGGDGTDIGAFESGAQLKAVSRKKHGTVGNFDITLPTTGSNLGIECRKGGTSGNYKVVFTFPGVITVTGADLTLDPAALNPTGRVSSFSVSGAIATVNLAKVSNEQTLLVNLRGVNDGTTTNDVTVPIGMLLGDVTGDGTVTSADDVSLTQSKVGQAVSKTTFREDVTIDGAIDNPGDVSLVQSKVGTALP